MNIPDIETLTNLNDFDELVKLFDTSYSFRHSGRLWCPHCRMQNRFWMQPEHLTINPHHTKTQFQGHYSAHGCPTWQNIKSNPEDLKGSQFRFHCASCHTKAIALIAIVSSRFSVLVFFEKNSSIATPNTPENIKYYLEQAYQCYVMKAYSATLAMFRTALDALLFNAGFKKGMVGQKIGELETAISAGNAPRWAMDLDTAFLKVLKDLGNSSLHISSEDISAEKNIDDVLVQHIELVFMEILENAYERDALRASRLEKLQAVAAAKKNKTT